jgi:predicted phage terminase large subunit-like protein
LNERKKRERRILIKREKAKRKWEKSYLEFFKRAWRELEPNTKLNLNWHIIYLCKRLQAEIERIIKRKKKVRDIIINVPFRSGKTRIVNEILNAWAWTIAPHLKFITSSYEAELSTRKATSCRRVMRTKWYQRHWPLKMVIDQNNKAFYQNEKSGYRMATSTQGTATGEGGDVLIIDDPIKPLEANSEVALNKAIEHYEQTFYSRLNEPSIGIRIIIMQRLHENDLTGHLLAKCPADYEHICFPGEETDNIKPTHFSRYYKNGLFDRVRLDYETLEKYKIILGSFGYAGQILQTPNPATGGIFKKYNWAFWQKSGQKFEPVKFKDEDGALLSCPLVTLPNTFDEQMQAWDTPFKDTDISTFCSGGHIGKKGPDIYLMDEVHKKMDYPAAVKAVKSFSKLHPKRSSIIIEDKANGPAIVADLKRTMAAIIPIPADKDKLTRAMPLSRAVESKNVFLPHPNIKPWVYDFIDEFAKFPKGKYNDRVDMLAHGYNKIQNVFAYKNIDGKI